MPAAPWYKLDMRLILIQLALALLFFLRASAATHYVNVGSTGPIPPYTSWATAANNIQDAVDSAGSGDQVVVTNGIYQAGSRVSPDAATNRVVVTNAITLQSVNGASVTSLDGGSAMRCIYLANGAALTGF